MKRTFWCHLFDQKTNEIFLGISALASKESSNQKTLLYNYVKQPLVSDIKCLNFFDPTSILEARAEIKNIFVGFLVQIRTRKFAFEINRPLPGIHNTSQKCLCRPCYGFVNLCTYALSKKKGQ